jgi:probable addiction module antidote protein
VQKNIGKIIKSANRSNGDRSTNGYIPPSEPWEPLDLELLKDPAEARAYLEVALEDGEPYYILKALNKIAKAQGGFSKLARKSGLSRENLYTALSPDGNPRFDSITKILHSLGLRMSVVPLQSKRRAPRVATKRASANRTLRSKRASKSKA